MATSNSSPSGKKRPREVSKGLSDADNGGFTEPPTKKQKLCDATIDDENDTMEIDETDAIKRENNALILFSGSFPDKRIDSFCSQTMNPNHFEVQSRSIIATTRNTLESLFLEGTNSTMDIIDIVQTGMFDEFVNTKSLTALLVSYDTDIAYQTLNVLTKTCFVSNTYQIYITLNRIDYVNKYQLLFGDGDNTNPYTTRLDDGTPQENESVINDNELQDLLMEDNVKCCCMPITVYSDPKHASITTVYDDYVRKYGINAMAKQCYHQAIENGCYELNVVMRPQIIETIWEYLGVVVHRNIDKYKIANYECKHCLNRLYLKQNERNAMVQMANGNSKKKSKKKSKASSNARRCEVCNVDVPSAGNNWDQHINGKKHKKKLKRQSTSIK